MRFHGDLTGATPIYRDMALYDASATGMVAGQAVGACAVAAGEGAGAVIDAAADTLIDIVGVLAETPSNALSVIAAGTEQYGRVIVNPNAFFLCEYSTESVSTNTAANGTGEVWTDTLIDQGEGGWCYCNGPSGNSAEGNLWKVGAADTSAYTAVTGTAYDDELKANDTSSTGIYIHRVLTGGVTGGSINLQGSTLTKIDGDGGTGDGDACVLENYISHSRFPMEPLRTSKHSGKKVPGALFYGDLWFNDHMLRGASTQA